MEILSFSDDLLCELVFRLRRIIFNSEGMFDFLNRFHSLFCVFMNRHQPEDERAPSQSRVFSNCICNPVSVCYSILSWTLVLLSVWTRFCQHVSVRTCQSKSVSYTNLCCQRFFVYVSVHTASRPRLLHHPADITTSKLLCCSTFWGLCARGSGANNKKGSKIVTSRHTWLHSNLCVHAQNRFILFI